MRRVAWQDLRYDQFESLLPFAGLVHGIFTRHGGVSRGPWASLNVGHTVGDDYQAVELNHRRIAEALGFRRGDLVTGYQVHGSCARVVDRRMLGAILPHTDALITAEAGVPLMLRFADCVPILLYDPERRIVGLAHAGWRGTAAGIARRAVRTMLDLGSRPESIWAGIGPSIGPCCYTVGAEVARSVQATVPEMSVFQSGEQGEFRLNLWEANRHQLLSEGVGHVEVANVCTACHTEDWYSHRAGNGHTGRFALVAMLTGSP